MKPPSAPPESATPHLNAPRRRAEVLRKVLAARSADELSDVELVVAAAEILRDTRAQLTRSDWVKLRPHHARARRAARRAIQRIGATSQAVTRRLRGHGPRAGHNHRRRGSRRQATRGSPDDPPGSPPRLVSPAVAGPLSPVRGAA
jgi:hypothetical protein